MCEEIFGILLGLNRNDLDCILLVGGQTRSNAIQEALSKEFGVELNKSVNPDEAVAMGAAIQANTLIGGDNASEVLLLDVTPLTLGIETMGNVMTQIVEENTTIPCKRSQIFSTAVDNQPAVTINVLQGNRPMAKDNKSIGVFNLDGIAPAKRGVPQIEVTFDIDANGILSVSAVDKATGKEQHITIESKNSLSQDEIERIKRDAEEHAAEDAKVREKQENLNKCESAIYQNETTIETMKDNQSFTDNDKEFFVNKIDELKKMKESDDFTNLDSVLNEINQRWYSITSKAYGNNNANGFQGNGQFDMNQFAEMFGGKNPFGNGFGATQNNTSNDNDVEEVK